MAIHGIELRIAKGIEVLNTDIEIVVKQNGAIFGTLTLSRGTIDWRPRKKRLGGKNEIRLGWSEFAKRMQEDDRE